LARTDRRANAEKPLRAVGNRRPVKGLIRNVEAGHMRPVVKGRCSLRRSNETAPGTEHELVAHADPFRGRSKP
jgi:hypothetical protein